MGSGLQLDKNTALCHIPFHMCAVDKPRMFMCIHRRDSVQEPKHYPDLDALSDLQNFLFNINQSISNSFVDLQGSLPVPGQ